MKRLKFLIVIAAIAGASFWLGYGFVVKAWPSPYNVGYFTGAYDTSGVDVWPADSDSPGCSAGGGWAIPSGIDSAAELISFVRCKLQSPNNYGPYRSIEATGAAFIIQTMIGDTGPKITSVNDARVTEWQNRVNYYASRGWIQWNVSYGYSYNSYFQGTYNSPSPNDDAFFQNNASAASIVFSNGSATYGIRRQCANPVGMTYAPLQDDQDFNMSGSTSVNDTTVTPGQVITFSHSLTNGGPTSTSPTSINWTTQSATSSSGPWSNVSSGNAGTFTSGQSKTPGGSGQSVTVPSNAAVGAQICRRITWTPDTETGGNDNSTPRCAIVQRTYTLTPTVQASAAYAQAGDTVTFTYRVANGGPHATSGAPSVCKAVGKLHPPGSPLPAQFADRNSDSGQNPPAPSCPSTIAGNNVPVTVGTESMVITNTMSPGTMVCRSLVINPYNTSGGTFSASPEACVTVAKAPYVRFGGNDVWAGGGFAAVTPACNTSAKITTLGRRVTNTPPMEYAGSATEYQAFALNRVSGFGSMGHPMINAGTLGGIPRMLIYGNAESNNNWLGFYGAAQHCIPDYSASYASLPGTAPGSTPAVTTAGSGAWRVTGNHTLSSSAVQMQAGSRKVYYVQGNVTINGNVTYPPSYASIDQLPSLLVIATGDIRVGAGVTQLDGQFVSRGTFYTCYPKTEPATTSTCNQQLAVNGGVMATRLDLFRTHGADGATPALRKVPAEVFNFTPELYLGSPLNTTTNRTTVDVVNMMELPPRF